MNVMTQAKSFLFIPANNESFVNKAHTRGADVIILDLEDSISIDQKDAARQSINNALDVLAANDQLAAVRVNGDLSNLVRDLETIDLKNVCAVMLPKVESSGVVQSINILLSELENKQNIPNGSTKLIGLIESAEGVISIHDICNSSERLIAVAIGPEDYAADIGCEPCEEALMGLCQSVILAASKAGIAALGFPGSIAEIKDLVKLQNQIDKAKRMGFRGALCIHPSQVAVVNKGFDYSEDQFEWAERVISEMQKAELFGQGVCTVDGQMIDAPILVRANQIFYSRA